MLMATDMEKKAGYKPPGVRKASNGKITERKLLNGSPTAGELNAWVDSLKIG